MDKPPTRTYYSCIMASELAVPHSRLEEMVNSSTHGLGLILSIGGLAVLVVLASIYGTASHVVGCSIYGATLVLLYTGSTCYHQTRSPSAKRSLRTIEQAVIFLLIAGTYTPFSLVVLQGGWGWSLFGLVWGLAVSGIISNTLYLQRFPAISNLVYLGMGWLCLIAIVPLKDTLPVGGLGLLLSGGLVYSLGVVSLSWNKIPFNHGVWHVSVLGGSICHYFAVLFYVLP